MKKVLFTLSVIIAVSAVAQVAAPKQDKKVTIILSVQEVDVVLNALQERPFKEVGGVINSIYSQASRQINDTTTIKKK